MTFKTERRKGINTKKITVTSNDPTEPRLLLEVSADLEQLLDANPRRQWFGRLKQEETVTKSFAFEGKETATVALESIELKDPVNKAAYTWKVIDEKTPEGIRNLQIEVTTQAGKIAPGRFNDILVVKTNLKDAPDIELYLSGEILGPITANPARLYFGQYDMNQEMTKTITLTSNTDTSFRILESTIPESEFKIDPWNRDAAVEHTLTIRLTPTLDRDRIRSNLVVKTDMPSQSEMNVDIHAYKRRERPGPGPMSPTGQMSDETKKAKPMGADFSRINTDDGNRPLKTGDARDIKTGDTREIKTGVQN